MRVITMLRLLHRAAVFLDSFVLAAPLPIPLQYRR